MGVLICNPTLGTSELNLRIPPGENRYRILPAHHRVTIGELFVFESPVLGLFDGF